TILTLHFAGNNRGVFTSYGVRPRRVQSDAQVGRASAEFAGTGRVILRDGQPQRFSGRGQPSTCPALPRSSSEPIGADAGCLHAGRPHTAGSAPRVRSSLALPGLLAQAG